MKGIYVNDDEFPFTTYIVNGVKTIETRTKDMLYRLHGHRVAIIRTKKGKAPEVVGYATLTGRFKMSAEELRVMRDSTCIPVGSSYDIKDGYKWGYRLSEAKKCDPYPVPKEAIKHGRSWAEWEGGETNITHQLYFCPEYKVIMKPMDKYDSYCIDKQHFKLFKTEHEAVAYAYAYKREHPGYYGVIERTETAIV